MGMLLEIGQVQTVVNAVDAVYEDGSQGAILQEVLNAQHGAVAASTEKILTSLKKLLGDGTKRRSWPLAAASDTRSNGKPDWYCTYAYPPVETGTQGVGVRVDVAERRTGEVHRYTQTVEGGRTRTSLQVLENGNPNRQNREYTIYTITDGGSEKIVSVTAQNVTQNASLAAAG